MVLEQEPLGPLHFLEPKLELNMLWDSVLWDSVVWDSVLWDSVVLDSVLWDSVWYSNKSHSVPFTSLNQNLN